MTNNNIEKKQSNGKRNGDAPRKHISGMMYLKFFVLVVFCFGAIVYLSTKILALKNDYGDEYERKAITQLINWGAGSEQPIRPNRGAVLDRNKQTIAYSTVVYNVFIDIRLLSVRDEAKIKKSFETLNKVLGIPLDELYALLEKDEEDKLIYDTNYHVIARQLPQSVANEIMKESPWDVYLEEDSKRSYVYGNLAPQVIGFIRGDSASGLEGYYNKELSGLYGRVFRTYDSNGRSVVTERVEAEEGYTLITTLDLTIQQRAEKLVEKYAKEYNAENASAIVMNPNTGEILAMAIYPSFNVNDPLNPEFINNEKYAESLMDLSQADLIKNLYPIWNNYNLSSTFEPGSIFKPITVAAALEEGIITLDDTFYCSGSLLVAGHIIHCNNRSGHGYLTLNQALAHSCNVALMHIAEQMGRNIFYKYQKDFGYGEKTGIDLPAEESASGLLHSLAELNASELATASFGQRFNCTPIQAITGFSALINGGYLYEPYIISQILGQSRVINERKPEIIRKVISKETSDYLRTALVDTLVYGTGKRAIIDGYNIGGKSGTAQQGLTVDPNYYEIASFIGYFPAEAPEYVALVMICKPEGPTPSASLMFKELVLDIISYKMIPPSDSGVSVETDVTVLEDYRGKTILETVRSLNQFGVDFELIGGSGTVIESQFPSPGTRITKESMVFLIIAESGEEELAEIPDVMGLTVKQACEAIYSAGFVPVVAYDDEENKDESNNTVYEQLPEPFLRITKGIEIRIKAK